MSKPSFKLREATLDGAEGWDGRLIVFEGPRSGFDYVLGIDVAEGLGKDRSVIEVLRLGTINTPDEQVAEFASTYHATADLVRCIETIGAFYALPSGVMALAAVETNGPGMDVVSDLASRGYDNIFERKIYDKLEEVYTEKIGWWTSKGSRRRLLMRGLHALQQKDLIPRSALLLDEMQDFTTDEFQAKAQAKSGRHDDRVMAFLIAYAAGHDDEWLSGEDIALARRTRTQAQVPLLTASGQPIKKDFQNTDISFDRMQAQGDEP